MSEATMTGAPRLTAAHFCLAAIGLMWTLPFLQPYHHFPLPSFYSEWLALALGLAALTWMGRAAFWRAAALPAALVPLLGLVVLLLVQYAVGKVAYGGQVLVAALYIVWACLLMVLARGLRRVVGLEGIATVLAWFLVVGGVVGAVLALLQHYQISDLSQSLIFPKRRTQVYGNLAQSNHFAAYSTLALASLAYLYAGRRLHWAGAAAGALPLLFVIGLSGSRSSLVFLALVLALALLYAWRGGAGGRRLALIMVLFIGGFAAAHGLAGMPGLESSGGSETVLERFSGGEGSAGAKSLDFRLQIARESWEMFTLAPWLGVGWGQFPWHDFEYRALHGRFISTWPFNNAHNIVLHLLAETGLVGTLLLAGAAALWLRCLKHAAIDLPHWWVAALIGVIAFHSLVEHPLWYGYFLGMAAVALGLLAPGDFRARLERAGAPLIVLLVAAGAVYAVSVLDNYRHFERLFARGAVAPGTATFAAIVGRAHREPALAPYAELAIATAMSLDAERVREKLEINGRVMRFAPISHVVYRQALLLAIAGEGAAAQRELARAARVYPQELPDLIKLMKETAVRHPSEMAPLIKSAAAQYAAWRAALDRR
jgi:O-antigen ligase